MSIFNDYLSAREVRLANLARKALDLDWYPESTLDKFVDLALDAGNSRAQVDRALKDPTATLQRLGE